MKTCCFPLRPARFGPAQAAVATSRFPSGFQRLFFAMPLSPAPMKRAMWRAAGWIPEKRQDSEKDGREKSVF